MLDRLLRVFASRNIARCLHRENRNEFYIDDPKYKGPSNVVTYSFFDEVKSLLFKVVQSNNRTIHFLAIDRCLLSSTVQMKRCDFALFDDKTLSFVEMKIDSEAGEEGLTSQELRRIASIQIMSTIDFFKNSFRAENAEFTYPYIEAIVAIPEQFPKNNATERAFAEKF